MKNASSTEKLTSTGTTDIASRVKNLFSGSPLNRRKRTMSSGSMLNNQVSTSLVPLVIGASLNELVSRDGMSVPYIIKKIVKYIEESGGLDVVGIYRINGNVKIIDKLRSSFDTVGDASFEDEDITSVAGLLKLFLRELPDGIIPEILMPHFVSTQESYPSQATKEALEALHHCLRFLPEQNYNVLKFLIRHLAKVSEHSSSNKMTAASLAIVFGPNLFHCGSGLEGLRLQGYSNSTVCRMIQNHKKLFNHRKDRMERDLVKPLPYAVHMAEKRESQLTSSTGGVATEVDSHFLGNLKSPEHDQTRSERSIDEAIQERSHGTLSPTSPSHLPHDDDIPPSSVPPPEPLEHSVPMVTGVEPSDEGGESSSLMMQMVEEELEGEGGGDGGTGFQRRYAKRGMSYKPRHEGEDSPYSPSRAKRGRLTVLNPKEDNTPLRTPSPYSHHSPGTSPPISPRGSSMLSSTVGASVKDFLFKPPPSLRQDSVAKQNVYGLLVPELSPSSSDNNKTSTTTSSTTSCDINESHMTEFTDSTAPLKVVLRKKTKNTRGQRNRKSALHGEDIHSNSSHLINDMNVQLLSVSPEHQEGPASSSFSTPGLIGKRGSQGDDPVEFRVGKVMDLVKQLEESECLSSKVGRPRAIYLGGDSVDSGSLATREGSVEVDGGEGSGEKEGRKRLSSLKAFEAFEKSGVIMGMGNPPKIKHKVSFSSATTNITSTATSCTWSQDSESVRAEEEVKEGERKMPSSATTASDEDVFISPIHFQLRSLPSLPSTQSRGLLSTTTSDDVFLSPIHASKKQRALSSLEETVDGGSCSGKMTSINVEVEFDEIAAEPTIKLHHPTLLRPKGPPSRRKPRRASAPVPDSTTEEVEEKRHSYHYGQEPLLHDKDNEISSGEGPSSLVLHDDSLSRAKQRLQLEPLPALYTPSSVPTGSLTSFAALSTPSSVPTDSITSPALTTPSSVPTGSVTDLTLPKDSNKENAHMGGSDLTSLAPESKQEVSTVRQGWQDRDNKTKKPTESNVNVKEISRRVHELKVVVREFEATFIDQHGHKPSGHEKSPIRHKIIEIAKLKKMLKELKEASSSEVRLNQTAPPEVGRKTHTGSDSPDAPTTREPPTTATRDIPTTTATRDVSTTRDTPTTATRDIPTRDALTTRDTPTTATAVVTRVTLSASTTRNTPTTSSARDMTAEASPPISPLEEILNKIMSSLETRRNSHGRPEELESMNETQIREEKRTIQKLLLNFEKHHGRPQTSADKEVMRPLYDRYRAVKRFCSGSREFSKTSLSMVTPRPSLITPGESVTKLGSTTDTLGSLTLMQSGDISDLSKSGEGLMSPLGKARFSDDKDNATSSGSKNAKHLLTEEELSLASLSQLLEQRTIILGMKSELRKILRDFENEFTAMHKRSVTRLDRKHLENEYGQYKIIKTKLRNLEALIAKNDPHKTV